jgi:hypothetical protein
MKIFRLKNNIKKKEEKQLSVIGLGRCGLPRRDLRQDRIPHAPGEI